MLNRAPLASWVFGLTFCLTTGLTQFALAAGPALELKQGDHIAIVGNTLADRAQHAGWLETLIHSRYPQHQLVFRNLGFSGDELNLRLRSQGFGSPEEWLKRVGADVVFAFFGYNEAQAGPDGVAKFKQELDGYVKKLQGQKFGKAAPRIVLFSPIAHEDLKTPHLPDGVENNAHLKLYTAAMAEVAEANKVTFVDLYTPSLAIYQRETKALTINGIHLNDHGDRLIAEAAEAALFPGVAGNRNPEQLEKIRQAVLDKNFQWFHRYRTTDGFSIYGGRGDLKFVGGQTNRDVAMRELEIQDVLTANRDVRVWAVAQGKEHKVNDDNTPAFLPVTTNKPGPLPGGKHVFLGGAEAISKMTIGKNLEVKLFASEEQFPELINPVQMAFDTKGRLWVAAWPLYPHWTPKGPMNDKLLILEDTNGDGQADKCTTFAGDLHNPTGFEFWNGGVLVANAPDLLFLKDTNGDDKYDIKERVLHGLDSADTHHTANSFTFDPGGALYFQEGTFHHSQIETPYGAARRVANGAVFRYEPRSQKIDIYVSHGFANPHGHAFDRWGQDIVVDGTGAQPYHGALFSGHVNFPQKHSSPMQVYKQRTRPCPGIEYLSSQHFPPEFEGNLLVPNVIGFQGILRYKVLDKGASFTAEELEPILSSSDPNFRPADVETGPDGAIYFTDWQNPIIGHMQHNLRDPSRDVTHGRVYRVTYKDRPLVQSPKVAGETVDNLVALLAHPQDRVRYRAKLELSARDSGETLAAVEKWASSLDKNNADYEHRQLEALWLHQHHNVVNLGRLERMIASPEPKARAAAARVLCYWRDKVSSGLELFKKLAADEHPRVRLEAVRAASFYTTPEAMEIVAIASELPSDEYIDFVRNETVKTLDPIWKKAMADNSDVRFSTDAGARYLLKSVTNEKLLKAPRNRIVFVEMLYRAGLRDEHRQEAVKGLAKLDNKTELAVVMDGISALDARAEQADVSVIFDLIRQLTSRKAAELTAARAGLEKLATSAKQPIFRQVGYIGLINVDGSVDQAWALAGKSAESLRDLCEAMPLIQDQSVRANLYPKVAPLVNGLPEALGGGTAKMPGTLGRYVRIELPDRGTLTLAEVEVYVGGRNAARGGRASQKNTAHGGDAAKGNDGNTNGSYGGGGQTHTEENTNKPWWEVDLGDEMPIEKVVVFNRTEGDLGQRLQGFSIKVLDKARTEVFKLEKIPAPAVKSEFALGGGGPEVLVRRSAMQALTSVRGQEAATFKTLAKFVKDDVDRVTAMRAIQKLPKNAWPKEDAPGLIDVTLAVIRKLPAAERTTPDALDAIEFADALATLLPTDQAKNIRKELGELGVRVIRLGTLFERMAYDKDVLVVKAGKPVEFIFENTDLMPHNLAIVQPGAMEEIGLAAEASAQAPDAAARHYVPNSGKVLMKSRLLQPRESQKISWTAPAKPGVYPFVCTYPGHWRRMYGALYVVEDLDAYQENAEAYLAAHPLEIKDALLKDNRPRTEWKLEDLAAAVNGLQHGRNYGTGKQMFTVANCVACHKLEGLGNQIGPDLTKLEAKDFGKPIDILKEILDPSAKINDKFKSWTIELESGKVVTGLIIEETPAQIKLVENPLAKADALVIKVSDIASRTPAKVSLMPKGLLDKMTREEILDLIAYVFAKGNKNDPLFSGGHDHGGHGGH